MHCLQISIFSNANNILWPTLNRYYKNLIFKMKSKSLEGLKAMMWHLYGEINCFFPSWNQPGNNIPQKQL